MLPSSSLNWHKVLKWPSAYAASQWVLAPGAQFFLKRKLRSALKGAPPGDRVLDVGSGPASWLSRIGLDPVGLDYSWEYVRQYSETGHTGVLGSADRLPFEARSFDSVWTVGVFHHLVDDSVREAVREMIRVCRNDGHVVIFDAVMPRSVYRRPLAYLLRRLDRGRFVRSEDQFLSLLRSVAASAGEPQRFTFSLNGLEAVQYLIRIRESDRT